MSKTKNDAVHEHDQRNHSAASIASNASTNTTTTEKTAQTSNGNNSVVKALREIKADIERRIAAKQTKSNYYVVSNDEYIFAYIYGFFPHHVYIFNQSDGKLVTVAVL